MNLKKLLYKSGSITGYILGLVGSIVTILAVNGTITIGLRWLVIFAICEIFIITVAILSFINYKRVQNEASRFEVDSYEPSDGKDFFYIHFSKLFRYQALVSIYVTINDISKRMGFGVVSNVSENQYIEIEVVKIFSGYESHFEKAKLNDKKTLAKMYIMPIVYSENISVIYESMTDRGDSYGKN